MNRWYRAYAGLVSDPKLGEAAVAANVSRSVVIATWHTLLEAAAEAQDRGRHGINSRRIAATLGEPEAVIGGVLAAFDEIGLTTDGVITAWVRRQFESDSSTERSRKHREAKRNGDATLQGRRATPPETETETESDTDTDSTGSSLRSDPPSPATAAEVTSRPSSTSKKISDWPTDYREMFWKAYPEKVGKAAALRKLEAIHRDGRISWSTLMDGLARCVRSKPVDRDWCHPTTWLNQGRWDDEPQERGTRASNSQPSSSDLLVEAFARQAGIDFDSDATLQRRSYRQPHPSERHPDHLMAALARRARPEGNDQTLDEAGPIIDVTPNGKGAP